MSLEDKNTKRRRRYAEDASYRERLLANVRARYAQDTEFRERVLATNRAGRRKRDERLQTDPGFREKERNRLRTTNWRNKSKIVGMTTEYYKRMLVRQHAVCKICRREEPNKTLCVDHRHATGWVRGLLCRKCNIGLGVYDDNPIRLVRAAAYLVVSRIKETVSRLLAMAVSFLRPAAAGVAKLIGRARP
jgi:hypothetical protein